MVDQRPKNDKLFFVISMSNCECCNAIIFFIYITVQLWKGAMGLLY